MARHIRTGMNRHRGWVIALLQRNIPEIMVVCGDILSSSLRDTPQIHPSLEVLREPAISLLTGIRWRVRIRSPI
jgi:hypothetical protein